jgi:hypothetical protein
LVISATLVALVVADRLRPGFFPKANVLGPVVVFLLYFSDEFAAPSRWSRLLTLLAAGVAVFLTQSRDSLLLLIAYVVLSRLRTPRRQIMVFVVAGVMILLVYATGTLSLACIHLYGQSLSDTSGRVFIWQVGLNLLRRFPLGMGYAGYEEALMAGTGRDTSFTVHNTYLNIAAQFGLPFLAVYLFYVGQLFRSTRSSLSRAFVLATYLWAFFESGTPFAYSLRSAMLVLPLYVGRRSKSD